DVTQPLTGTARAEQTRDLLVTLLQGVAAAAPLALFIEDAHWLDSASWALVLDVAQRVAPALLVVATRPLAEPLPTEYVRLLESPNTTHLQLQPLSANDTQTLICQRLGVRRLPEAIAALIRNKAEGHPFFSEELAYAMRDTGLIEIADGECRVMPHVDLQAVALPDTVQGVIISRIDRLLPQQQLTLKVASTIGTNFGVQMLRDIHPIDDDKPRLENYLRALERVDLTLLDAPEPNLTYAFKHIITRDVAYNLMLFAQRRQLHRAVAEWHERTAADDLSPYYPLLAYHWTMAGVTVKALDYLEKASLQAYSNGLTKEATTLGLEAARLLGVSLPTDPREIVPAIGAEMGEIQQRMAGRAPSELIDLPPLDEPDIGSVVGTLLRTMPFAYTSRQPELFALMAVKNLSLTLKHGHGLFSPLAYSMYAIVYRAMTGDSRTAHAFSQLALDLNARQGHALTASVEFVHTWFINHWVNPIASNLDMNLDGARAGFASGDLLYACFNSAAYVVYLSAMGAPLDDVIAMGAQQLAVINNRVANAAYHCLHEMQFAKALAGRTRDRFSFSDAQYDEARDVASIVRTDLYNQIGYYYVSKLRLHYYYGDYAAALEYAAQAQPLLPAFEGQVAEPEYRLFGALALLARSREVEASARDELLALAAAHLEKLRAWSAVYAGNFTHKLKLVEAEWARNAGRDTEAQASYREAAQSAEQFGFTHHAALANELAAQHALALGDTTVARAHLAAARDGYARWGAWAKVKDVEERYRLPIPPQ
ncbi:MAG: hypothetical protein ABI874_10710, partial [Chloroflexota bacterium]